MKRLIISSAEELGVDTNKLLTDTMAMKSIKVSAERMKREMSKNEFAKVTISGVEVTITRVEFVSEAEAIVGKTISKIKEVLARLQLNSSQIKLFILAGGTTRFPLIRSAIASALQITPFNDVDDDNDMDPDTIVGLGAGLVAASYHYARTQNIRDTASMSIGMEVKGKAIAVS